MSRYDSMMAAGVVLSVLMLLQMFIAPWPGQEPALIPTVIGILIIEGLVYWYWRIYLAASTSIEPANPVQGRKVVFLVAGVGTAIMLLLEWRFGLTDRDDIVGAIANLVGVPVIFSVFYAIWLTAKALAGLPAKGFALFNNAAMLRFLQLFYLPIGIFFLRRRLKELFPD